ACAGGGSRRTAGDPDGSAGSRAGRRRRADVPEAVLRRRVRRIPLLRGARPLGRRRLHQHRALELVRGVRRRPLRRHARQRFAALLLLVTATVGPAAAARERASAPASTAGESCRRLPEGKRLRLNLKPNTELVDLISWISAITCKSFIVPGTIPSQGKTVTIV